MSISLNLFFMALFTEIEAQALLQKVLSFSKADECEASLVGGSSGNLRFARNTVSTSGGADTLTLDLQSTFGRRTGRARTYEFDDASLAKAVRQSEELARLAPENLNTFPSSVPSRMSNPAPLSRQPRPQRQRSAPKRSPKASPSVIRRA